jgi:small-conductance mechanosensitive channel
MDNLANLLNPYVFVYLLTVISAQILYGYWRQQQRDRITTQRRTRGLPPDNLLHQAERLEQRRRQAAIESALFLVTGLVLPFGIVACARLGGSAQGAIAAQSGLAIAFVALLLVVIWGATDAIRAFWGGLAFKVLAAFVVPFQMGDRLTIGGISGKAIRFNSFFLTLETPSGEWVNLPTHTLWNEILTSPVQSRHSAHNSRATLCEIAFYLSPATTAEQCQAVETAVLNAIHTSVYFEPSQPVQVYLSQSPKAIQLTASAHVGSDRNQPLFVSDITRAFLKFVCQQQIFLAT